MRCTGQEGYTVVNSDALYSNMPPCKTALVCFVSIAVLCAVVTLLATLCTSFSLTHCHSHSHIITLLHLFTHHSFPFISHHFPLFFTFPPPYVRTSSLPSPHHFPHHTIFHPSPLPLSLPPSLHHPLLPPLFSLS